MLLLRSLVFDLLLYGSMAVLGLLFAPAALVSRNAAYLAIRVFLGFVLPALRLLCGLRTEVRGQVPTGEALVAAKHQSFLDILILARALPRVKFIMKRELVWAPVLGFYALRIGATPVRRGARREAVTRMVDDVAGARRDPGQTVIYPQGTRVAPGLRAPYKIGAGVLYERYGLPCVPVATNAGAFWGRNSLFRRPGLAVVEFLPPIEAGLSQQAFMARLEREVEAASERLLAEARGDA